MKTKQQDKEKSSFKEIVKALLFVFFFLSIGILILFISLEVLNLSDTIVTIILFLYVGGVYTKWIK